MAQITYMDWMVQNKVQSITNDSGLGLYAAELMGKGMNPYVPYAEGALSGTYITEPFAVTYTMPYAAYQFYGIGFNFRTDGHPQATAKWSEAYKNAHGQQLADQLTKYLKR